MKPTEEQNDILNAKGRVLLINARAGTGKTTTLRMISNALPDLKILYLVYNRKSRQEAEGKFGNNVEIRTLHSLAFSGNIDRWKEQVGTFTIADILPAFKDMKEPQQLSALSYNFIEFFLNSPFPKIEQALEIFHEKHLNHLTDEIKKAFKNAQGRIIQTSRDILNQWYRRERTCPHDFYLKLFHREGGFYKVLNRYDRILVDEGQDLSPIMLDALKNCQKPITIVGDTHQQVYSFRYAIDAMKRFSYDRKRDLTMSFRFGKKIADLASVFVREAKGEKGFNIRGNPKKSSMVSFYTDLPRPKKGKRCAVLSRTNLALFEKAMDLRSRGIPFSLEGNIRSIFGRILDVYWLAEGRHDKIRNPLIRSFKGMDYLEAYARDMGDFQLAGITKLVREYTPILPNAVYDMMRVSDNTTRNKKSIILSTVHGAKGQEYDRVYIDPDIADSLSRSGGASSARELADEANIAYVAFTRAIHKLYIPRDFKDILTPEWRAAMKRY